MHINNKFAQDIAALNDEYGVSFPGAMDWMPDGPQGTASPWRRSDAVAMDQMPTELRAGLAFDAQPPLVTAPNSAIPWFLTAFIDPALIRVLVAPSKAAEIFGEVRKGNWIDETAMFTLVERTGEVSSYGDRNNNGRAGVNTNFPQRQAYLFQTIINYGEREMERAGRARIGWAAELKESAVMVLNKFANQAYFFGVSGLQNYGITNDPNLSAALTPGVKINGNGNVWMNGNVVNATPNEVYADIQSLFAQIVAQTAGLVDQSAKMTLAMSPTSEVALTSTNGFNVNVTDQLKKNFPNITVKTAVQYGKTSSTNPQGIAGGSMVQLIVDSVDGQETGYCAFNEKLRAHRLIPELSAFKQKFTSGVWGAIVREPIAMSQMVGV